jgi:hypothetical protein
VKDRQYPTVDEFLERLANGDVPDCEEGPHLISADELRAAGALDVPPAWRKSLSARIVQRDLFSDLSDEEEPLPDDQAPSPGDEDDDNKAGDALP